MNSRASNTLRKSTHLALNIAIVLGTVLFAAHTIHAQQLQKGVSVQMAVTTSAPSVPEADSGSAWIVTVTGSNDLYFGVDPVTPQGLLDAMKVRPRARAQELFVKADARASFATVAQVLNAAHANLFDRAVLLTGQSSGAQPGTIVSPKGLTLWIGSAALPEAVVVEIGPGQGSPSQESPTLKIDNQEVPLKALQLKLEQLLRNHKDRVVVLKAEQVPFVDVVHVVDVCNTSGAKTVLATPTL